MVAREPRSLKELILLTLAHPNPIQLVIAIAILHFLPSTSSVLKEFVRKMLTLGGWFK